MRGLTLLFAVGFLANSDAPPVVACEYLVRDFAFRTPRDIHNLVLFAHSDDEPSNEIEAKLKAWLEGDGAGLNIEFVRADVDDPEIDWAKYGVPSAPPAVPVVALIGRNYGSGERFLIRHWVPAPSDDDLALLAHSPLRTKLQQRLGKQLAVILYAPNSVEGDGSEVPPSIQEFVSKVAAKSKLAVSILKVDRSDPQEQCLLSFAGIPPEGPAWAGIVFGRGKLMSPPLVGEEITAERLQTLIGQLDEDCSCTKPLPALGVDLPLVWTETLDKHVVRLVEDEGEPDNLLAPALPSFASGAGQTEEAPATAAAASASDQAASAGHASKPAAQGYLKWSLAALLGGIVVVVFVGSIFVAGSKNH
jgi:hypothetical protein